MPRRAMVLVAASMGVWAGQPARGQGLVERFDPPQVPPGVSWEAVPSGWVSINASSPVGTNVLGWTRVYDAGPAGSPVFFSQSGGGYASTNFNVTSGVGTCDAWLISPPVSWSNGTTLEFWTRTRTRGASGVLRHPDRLQVRLATGGGITAGTVPELLASYSVLALDINPNLLNNPAPGAPSGSPPTVAGYPDVWTRYTVVVSGLAGPSVGRLAFRYIVTNGGPLGLNSDYIGVDEVVVTPGGATCYANCDGSTGTPVLSPADFVCFLQKYRAGDGYANCDGSTGTPALTPADFVCFLSRYRTGC